MSKHNVYAKELSNPQYKQRIVENKKGKSAYSRKDRKYRKTIDYD